MKTGKPTEGAAHPVTTGGAKRACPSLWLVDDDVEFRQLCADILQKDGGFECPRQFGSAEAVIDALSQSPGPELMLLEMSLPGMSGATAVQTIQSLSPGTRVFMFSTFFDVQRAAEGQAAGASGFFRKCDLAQALQLLRPLPGPGGSDANAARK